MTDDKTTDDETNENKFPLEAPYVTENDGGITEVSLEQESDSDAVNIFYDPFINTQRGTQRPEDKTDEQTPDADTGSNNRSRTSGSKEIDQPTNTTSDTSDTNTTEEAQENTETNISTDSSRTETDKETVETPDEISATNDSDSSTATDVDTNNKTAEEANTTQDENTGTEAEENIITGTYTPTKSGKEEITKTHSNTEQPSYKRVAANAGRGATGAAVSVINIIGWLFMRIFEIFTALLLFCTAVLVGMYVVTALIPGLANEPFLLWGAAQLGAVALLSAGLSVIGSRIAGKPDRYGPNQQSLEYS